MHDDGKHDCPVKDCNSARLPRHPDVPAALVQVPRQIRAAVNATWARGISLEYLKARQAAIDAVDDQAARAGLAKA